MQKEKHMKTINNIIYVAFLTVVLGLSALTAKAAPGDLFVSDAGIIYKFAPDGTRSTFATGLNGPLGLAFDSAGNLFDADQGTATINKFAPDGTRSTFTSAVNAPVGLAVDSADNLFEADAGTGRINKFAPDGTQSTFATGLNGPSGLAFDSAGNLFETDILGGTINKFAPDGTRSTFATGLNRPVGLAFDSAGYLFATERDNGTILKFAPDGAQSTFATGLNFAVGLAFDSAGNLFEADAHSHTIYKFAPDGTRSTFATGLSPAFLAIQPAVIPPYAAQIQQPINSDGTSIFNVRRGVVPVKFTLTQSGVPTCTLPPATIAVTRTAGGTTGPIDESIYIGSADTGSNFRTDSCQYVYNLNASALGVGTYRVDIKINDQVVGSASFQLK
jgi:sugar lactone lactonase YvrE